MLRALFTCLLLTLLLAPARCAAEDPVDHAQRQMLQRFWPNTDLNSTQVPLRQIRVGAASRHTTPAIHEPFFMPVGSQDYLGAREPVVVVQEGGQVRLYPLSILLWHGVVNDVIGGRPIAVTYCPLCNAALVFDRRVGGRTLSFGVSGLLRHADMVLFDLQTESWWQQFTGEAIVGELAGERLHKIAVQLKPYAMAGRHYREAQVLSPPGHSRRPYGWTPFRAYDSRDYPPHYPESYGRSDVPPMTYVLVVDGEAWTVSLLRERRVVQREDGLRLTWTPGMASVLDEALIDEARDLGSITVTRGGEPVPHILTFAYAFDAFHPEGRLHTR